MSKDDTYTIMIYFDYEGESPIFEGTLDQVKEWLTSDTYYRKDYMTLYSNNCPTIEELINEQTSD